MYLTFPLTCRFPLRRKASVVFNPSRYAKNVTRGRRGETADRGSASTITTKPQSLLPSKIQRAPNLHLQGSQTHYSRTTSGASSGPEDELLLGIWT